MMMSLLPLRFETLRLIIIRGGLKQLTPNQVLGDVMTQETYCVEREGVDKDEKKEDEDKKKKSVAFKVAHHPRTRASPRKKNQVMMKIVVTLMMKPWLCLCASLEDS